MKGELVVHSVSVPVWCSLISETTQIIRNIQKDSAGKSDPSCAEPLRKVVAAPLQPFAPSVVDLATTGAQRLVTWSALHNFLALHNSDGPAQGINHRQHLHHATSAINTYGVCVRCLLRIVAIWVPIVL